MDNVTPTWGDDGVGLLKEMSLWWSAGYYSAKREDPHWYVNKAKCFGNSASRNFTADAAYLTEDWRLSRWQFLKLQGDTGWVPFSRFTRRHRAMPRVNYSTYFRRGNNCRISTSTFGNKALEPACHIKLLPPFWWLVDISLWGTSIEVPQTLCGCFSVAGCGRARA